MKTWRAVPLLAAMLAACSKEPPPPSPAVDHGRPETRSLEAADPMGYNGHAVREKVDSALNANDAANAQLEQAARETNRQ